MCTCSPLPHMRLPRRYVVPPAHRARFEQLMRSLLPDLFRACPEFMRHKVGSRRACVPAAVHGCMLVMF